MIYIWKKQLILLKILLIFDINFFNPKTLKVHLKSSGKDDFSKDKEIQDYDEKTDGEASYYYVILFI